MTRGAKLVRDCFVFLVIDLAFLYGLVKWLFEYISYGYIRDLKHGLELHGLYAIGHIFFAGMGFVVVTFLLVSKFVGYKKL